MHFLVGGLPIHAILPATTRDTGQRTQTLCGDGTLLAWRGERRGVLLSPRQGAGGPPTRNDLPIGAMLRRGHPMCLLCQGRSVDRRRQGPWSWGDMQFPAPPSPRTRCCSLTLCPQWRGAGGGACTQRRGSRVPCAGCSADSCNHMSWSPAVGGKPCSKNVNKAMSRKGDFAVLFRSFLPEASLPPYLAVALSPTFFVCRGVGVGF